MEDFITNQQKVSTANRKFLDLCRTNESNWVTCDQAERILNDIGFQSSAKIDGLIGEADSDGSDQIEWDNLLGIITYLTTNDNANERDHSNEDEKTNEDDQSSDLPDDEEVKHNALDFAKVVLKIGKQNGSVSNEQLLELAEQFKINKNQ